MDPTSVTAEIAFATFLKQAETGPLLFYNYTRRDIVLELLSIAAHGGLIVAKALCTRVHQYFGKTPEYVLETNREEWLFDSIASGAIFLTCEAQALDEPRYKSSMERFRRSGGFNSHYSRISLVLLHDLLDHSGLPDTSIIDYSGIPIEATKLLFSTGADASLILFTHGAGCLHWLFMFQSHQIDTLARELVEAGASLEAQSSEKIKMMHYPFSLPLGSPVHWAVEFSSKAAIIALLSCGADMHVRTHVSWGRHWREKNEGQLVMKHSSIDIATSNWDYEVLDLLLSNQSFDSVSNMDKHDFMTSHKLNEKLWLYIS
jgi:hypothetical protein